MTFNIQVEPSQRAFVTEADETILAAAIRQGIGLPYGCKDGACGSCKCKKVSGEVVHGPHQVKALSEAEEAAGFVLACCAKPLSDVVLESRQVTAAGIPPIKKMPVRVAHMSRPSSDVAVVRLQLPATEPFQYFAGQYVEFLLRDGDRRSYSMANAPHTQTELPGIELHIRHMPGGKFTDAVFSTMKERASARHAGHSGVGGGGIAAHIGDRAGHSAGLADGQGAVDLQEAGVPGVGLRALRRVIDDFLVAGVNERLGQRLIGGHQRHQRRARDNKTLHA
jgi:CDP-4-dehydro-6-deoxyglucose reductase